MIISSRIFRSFGFSIAFLMTSCKHVSTDGSRLKTPSSPETVVEEMADAPDLGSRGPIELPRLDPTVKPIALPTENEPDTRAISTKAAGGKSIVDPLHASVKAQLATSDLVFVGKTTSVRYGFSEPGATSKKQIPVTYITFKVEKIIKGSYKADTITVPQMGGWTKSNTFMLSSSQTVFAVGDRDLIVLRKNGTSLIPIRDDGRFPIVNDKVFTANGYKAVINSSNELVPGAFAGEKSIVQRPLGRKGMMLTIKEGPTQPNMKQAAKGNTKASGFGAPKGQATLPDMVRFLSALTIDSNSKTLPAKSSVSPGKIALKAEALSVKGEAKFNVDAISKTVAPK